MRESLQSLRVRGGSSDPLTVRAFEDPERLGGMRSFEFDRERIVQSRAFRRLAGKTQVFTSRESDHFRSRLTHTIEVAQIARQVACALDLNEVLAEALALVHDIGHPPFGHAGERALDACLREYGRTFDHNLHALRIVEHFEDRYAGHRGLNLTLGVREGIIKHSRDYAASDYPALAEYFLGERPPIEAQIIDLADEIAYLTADLDDGVESGLLEIGSICDHIAIMRRSYDAVAEEHPGIEEKFLFHEALQRMQKELTEDLIATTLRNVREAGLKTLEDVRHHKHRVAVFSDAIEEQRLEEKRYLYDKLYTCDTLEAEHDKAAQVVSTLFAWYMESPQRMPAGYVEEAQEQGLARVVADYIAGMTDSFILQQFWAAKSRSRR
ncbi:dGTP triphosphohydrolase [Terriglobus saanensis]|uniref:Deoxyguanosinetriphosphate triphosphohydrolase-like protein n=1 Tax=Terriglobus saanensis (strain ATCC BAA-1853 / DSM 23119 / SP1PR4) TaxID=401053 RepID=E8V886_TERSS|nr:dNTP triphosphohydrolase [Terriglobus saanensis]ADV81789.1 deoxyguanosinetriphosphate triphosphohydrolase [Terriglobus saanensis SP1PR4]